MGNWRTRALTLFILAAAALSGCAYIDFDKLAPAKISGSLFVMWVGEGGSSGDGRFVFVPDPSDPLTFRRANASSPGAVIQPGLMYTDGGSIPKVAQVFNGLSPWGYAPAYMIHDWMFTAHHCLVDGEDNSRFDQVRTVEFNDSARILGEAIQGLIAAKRVKRDDVAGIAITNAVGSPIARRLWDVQGECERLKVSAKHVAAVENAIPGSSRLVVRRLLKIAPETPRVSAPAATIITKVSF